jgi:hypothetical protein
MSVNCVVSVSTLPLPVIVGGVGVLQARIRHSHEAATSDADVVGDAPETLATDPSTSLTRDTNVSQSCHAQGG